jgi:hypothetical protein
MGLQHGIFDQISDLRGRGHVFTATKSREKKKYKNGLHLRALVQSQGTLHFQRNIGRGMSGKGIRRKGDYFIPLPMVFSAANAQVAAGCAAPPRGRGIK